MNVAATAPRVFVSIAVDVAPVVPVIVYVPAPGAAVSVVVADPVVVLPRVYDPDPLVPVSCKLWLDISEWVVVTTPVPGLVEAASVDVTPATSANA
ncbi:unnamed protein product [Gemmata massiliana]|uniref:Uncharacterized protein n=1 Tax=Gemmata massiliana TaxID=1210884 RepID=A0A6P2CVM4_9BACT|nr:hypothetical protein [Gemmata massiliana]VTR92953.1 unnamed protein product [Gemmata massiliana]